jgi:hypothetical protein
MAMAGQPGFFDVDERYAALSAAGDPLERLAAAVDFEIFRPVLDAALVRSDRSRGGRPPYDAVLMFRILVLQALYSLSDNQAEFQLRDRLSFMRFAGLGLHQAVPDAKTVCSIASNSSRPVPSRGCSAASTRSWPARAIWPWAGRSSMPA